MANRLERIPRDTFKPVWIRTLPLFAATEEAIFSSQPSNAFKNSSCDTSRPVHNKNVRRAW